MQADDETLVIDMSQQYGPGDYVHVLAKVLEYDPTTDSFTLQLHDKDNDYPVVVRRSVIAGGAPVPTPDEPLGDAVMVIDANASVWRPDFLDGERRWFTTNDVLGDTWENVFRKRGPLRIFELSGVTDNPKGSKG